MDTYHLVEQIIKSVDTQLSDLSNFNTEIQSGLDGVVDILKRDKKRLKNLTNHRKIQDKDEKARILLELIDSFYDMNKKIQALVTNWQLEMETLGNTGLHLEHSLRYLYFRLPDNK